MHLPTPPTPPTTTLPYHVRLLGRLEIALGSDAIVCPVIRRFRTQKTAALFAYLVSHSDHPHPREELIDRFWPDADIEEGRVSLRTAVASLRRQLEPPGVAPGSILLADRGNIGIERRAVVVDAVRFEASLQAARREAGAAARTDHLIDALALYAGPLLPGFYDDWILTRREHLAELHRQALRQATSDLARTGRLPLALECARRAAEADPSDEEVRELLQRLLAGAKSSVPLLPTASPAAAVSAEAIPPPPRRKPRVHLPPQFSRFFGRETEIKRIGALLKGGGDAPLVTLLGPGGGGKTRLAIESVRRLAASEEGRRDDIYFVALAEVRRAEGIGLALRDALALPLEGEKEPLEQAIDALTAAADGSPLPPLLVFDNFEQIAAEGAAIVQRLRTRVPGLACLVTSRRRLALPGEQVVAVEPLPVPSAPEPAHAATQQNEAIPAPSPAELLRIPSVALFVDRAQACRPDFQITRSNADAVARLCARLEGIPLAIELAAAWAGTLTPAQMQARLDAQPLDLLEAPKGNRRRQRSDEDAAFARHRSLRATIQWSVGMLAPETAAFFARLSVFRGGWTVEEAERICDAPPDRVLDWLAQLRERSLIVSRDSETMQGGSGGEVRFGMLETIREFAAARLLDTGKAAGFARRHGAFFADLAEQADREIQGEKGALWLARLETEHDNLRAALEESIEDRENRVSLANALRIAGHLYMFWYRHGHQREAAYWCDRALRAAADAPDDGDPPLATPRGRALNVAGLLANWRGDYAAAEDYLTHSLATYRGVGNQRGTFSALNNLGIANRRQGCTERARELYDEALTVIREIGHPGGTAMTLNNLANLADERGEAAEASRLYAEALVLQREMGDQYEIAVLLGNLADTQARVGDRDAARDAFAEALALCETLDARPLLPKLFVNIARCCLDGGDTASAARLAAAAEAQDARLGQCPAPADAARLAELVSRLRAALGNAEWERLRAEGARMNAAAAMAAAREAVNGDPGPDTEDTEAFHHMPSSRP